MSSIIKDLKSPDIQSVLKELTGISFQYSPQRPQNSIFCLEACTGDINSPHLQWAVKNNSGLLLMTDEITTSSFWRLPDDLLGFDREDAFRELQQEYDAYIENIENFLYEVNYNYDTTIKLDKSEEPRLYVYLSNHQTKNDLTNALYALEILLPQLVNAI